MPTNLKHLKNRKGSLFLLYILTSGLVLGSNNLYCQPFALYFWSGALTSESIRVNAKLSAPCSQVRLAVDIDSSFNNPIFSHSASVNMSTNLTVSFFVDKLIPNTIYYYAFEIYYVIDLTPGRIGSFRTPQNGPFSFTFAFNSCIGNAYHTFTQRVKNHDPLFFINMGDLHYGNPNSTDINVHRIKYEGSILHREPTKSFLRHTPIAYVWDDHDFCGNNSDSTFIGKENARQAYREYVPHYFLPDPAGAIYQAFTIGRLHFIMTDLRSTKSPAAMMLKTQHDWFKQQLLYARDNKLMAVWVSSLPWNAPTHHENWGAYPAERAELANFFRDSNIVNMMILAGDAHMLAIDDGENADFSTGQPSPFRYPLFHAGGVAKGGSVKGGQFNAGGPFKNTNLQQGHYGIVRVFDNGGDTICFSLEGYRTDNDGLYDSLLVNYTFCRNLQNSSPLSIPDVLISVLPADGTINLIFSEYPGEVKMELLGIDGRACFFTRLTAGYNQKVLTVPIPPSLKGIFIVRIIWSKKTINRKIFIPRP